MAEKKDKLFKYHEDIDKLPDIVTKYFSPKTVDVFRTIIEDPPSEKDSTPQVYRFAQKEDTTEQYTPTAEELKKLSEEDQKKYITARALSFHDSREKAEKSARHSYESLTRKISLEEAEDYIQNERGTYIAQFHITEVHGQITEFHKHHANVLLYEGVTLNDILVPGTIRPYKYKEDNGNE